MSVLDRTDLRARMAQGAAAGAVVTAVSLAFRSATGADAPASSHWLLQTALCACAGAAAGAVYFGTAPFRARGGWRKTAANVVTLLSFCAVVLVLVALSAWSGLVGR